MNQVEAEGSTGKRALLRVPAASLVHTRDSEPPCLPKVMWFLTRRHTLGCSASYDTAFGAVPLR
jgi:hypothetical protein